MKVMDPEANNSSKQLPYLFALAAQRQSCCVRTSVLLGFWKALLVKQGRRGSRRPLHGAPFKPSLFSVGAVLGVATGVLKCVCGVGIAKKEQQKSWRLQEATVKEPPSRRAQMRKKEVALRCFEYEQLLSRARVRFPAFETFFSFAKEAAVVVYGAKPLG